MKITTGTTFHSTYADSNPLWKVVSSRGGDTWNCVVVDSPDWNGTKKVFGGEEIRASIQMAQFWNKIGNDSDSFYQGLPVGAIVHYSNGFNQFVRCQVTKDKQLLPIALVGEWKSYDLPSRYNNGEIVLPYHVKNIVEKKPFQPHASNVYEYSKDLQKRYTTHPRSLNSLILDVPAMTAEQSRTAHFWKKIEAIQTIIQNGRENPEAILAQIKNTI